MSNTHILKYYPDPPGPPLNPFVVASGSTWVFASWFPPNDRGGTGAISMYVVTAQPQATSNGRDIVVSNQRSLGDRSEGVGRSNSLCVEVPCETYVVSVAGNDLMANLTGLVPALTYTLVVSAFSNGSRLQSVPSEPVTFMTLQHGMFTEIDRIT